ncbi:hypothetical protein [Nocardia abscessus]|uniref:hypothetical protein n=1 Tax=Nocardia abscessus TaxID=120957 RepID=UPI0024584259|nr:hypothetical protein [Nocardia abscessus]
MTVAADKAGRQWAAAQSATLAPGTKVYTEGAGQCTTNYVFTDDAGNFYLGQAAHCATTGQSNATDGCTFGSLPLGTIVLQPRWLTLRAGCIHRHRTTRLQQLADHAAARQDRPDARALNDIALVKITPELAGSVNPSLPYWGWPGWPQHHRDRLRSTALAARDEPPRVGNG